MMDEELYRETFSQLRASKEAKEEVFQMTKQHQSTKRLPKALRTAAIAAIMVCALAVTAGAVNVATDGLLFRVLWQEGNHMQAVDEQGNQVYVTVEDGEILPPDGAEVVRENGRLLLRVNGEEVDITDDLEQDGRCQYTYEETETLPDGSAVTHVKTLYVTGSLLEGWDVAADK